MKLQMEFEDADFREMIFKFFDQQGFVLHNLDELCAHFNEVFPNGLKASVAVKPGPVTMTTPVDAASLKEETPQKATATPEAPPAVRIVTPLRKKMTKEDLMDPTIESNVPHSEDLKNGDLSEYDAAGEVPLDAVLKQSKELEQETDV